MARESLALGAPPAEAPTLVTDTTRLARMVDDHLDFIWRLLRRFGVPERDADDASQLVFVVASRRLADIPPGFERTFLYGAAVRVASNFRRAARRHPDVLSTDLDLAPDPSASVEDAVDQRRARALLDTIVAEMSQELRNVFVLAEIEEVPSAEIAGMLSIPVGTVASRLRRARAEFDASVGRWLARQQSKGGAR